jgi:hypothetical protein
MFQQTLKDIPLLLDEQIKCRVHHPSPEAAPWISDPAMSKGASY